MKRQIEILAVILLSLTTFSCDLFNNDDDDDDVFLIEVESIAAPESVMLGDSVAVNFFGTIGPNGCFSFSHFEATDIENGIEIDAYGQYIHSRVCAAVIVDLDGRAYYYVPETRGMKQVRVNRQNRDPLERVINVE
ncbi:MAG: hypothetical protein WD267_01125 [Balneolales bacterium]